ncbi:hypothetical protein OROHE_012422 [Orobanche hederae]
MDSSLSSPNEKLQLSTNKKRIGADDADARPEKNIVTTLSSKRKCAAKVQDAKFDTRTSLTKLWLVNEKLQRDQKKCVEEMGFSSITKTEFEQLDRELVRWLVDRYNPDESLITLDNPCHINIYAAEASRALARKLESCVTSGDEFKVCYLMFMFGTLLFPDILPNIRVGYLNIIVNLEKVSYMNWAKLVVEKLNDGVKLRKEYGRTYLTGCSFLLQIIELAFQWYKRRVNRTPDERVMNEIADYGTLINTNYGQGLRLFECFSRLLLCTILRFINWT